MRGHPRRIEPGPGQESVWDYPRPPALVADDRLVVVRFGGVEVARTTRALRVLETSHPPTWYLPREDLVVAHLRPAAGASLCEWKGRASYFDLVVEDGVAGGRVAERQAWTYEAPTPAFAALAGHVAFYPQAVEATVDGEPVRAVQGDFYGGWVTDDVVGPFKGEVPGSMTW